MKRYLLVILLVFPMFSLAAQTSQVNRSADTRLINSRFYVEDALTVLAYDLLNSHTYKLCMDDEDNSISFNVELEYFSTDGSTTKIEQHKILPNSCSIITANRISVGQPGKRGYGWLTLILPD